MNGNITKAGIKLDLEWMQRAGIGGFQNFDAALGTPKLVDKRLVYMTPEWKDAFRYATTLADQLGLEEAIAGSPGWSESGGPWVKPSQGMTKLVWSETHIEGGHPLASALPKPPDVSGPFQNIPIFDLLAVLSKQAPAQSPKFYADAAVVALRLPNTDLPMSSLQPKITSNDGMSMDSTILSDGDLVKSIALHKAPTGRRAWVLFEFPAAQRMRALTLALGGPVNPFAESMGGLPPGQDVEALRPTTRSQNSSFIRVRG